MQYVMQCISQDSVGLVSKCFLIPEVWPNDHITVMDILWQFFVANAESMKISQVYSVNVSLCDVMLCVCVRVVCVCVSVCVSLCARVCPCLCGVRASVGVVCVWCVCVCAWCACLCGVWRACARLWVCGCLCVCVSVCGVRACVCVVCVRVCVRVCGCVGVCVCLCVVCVRVCVWCVCAVCVIRTEKVQRSWRIFTQRSWRWCSWTSAVRSRSLRRFSLWPLTWTTRRKVRDEEFKGHSGGPGHHNNIK